MPAAPVLPETPSVPTDLGTLNGTVRSFNLTAEQFTQQIANFPIKTAQVWGYNGSTPGPTLIAYEGETVRVTVTNTLPVPTTVHFHGMHEPNQDDGVAGISQPDPIQPGQTFTYEFTPGHQGTFAYHSHTSSAVQELRGLDGFFLILPRDEPAGTGVTRDFAMTLQQFAPPGEGGLVDPFPPGGDFPFSTINGKTGEASGGPITVTVGDTVRIRLYNASQLSHSMHLHGMDFTEVARNGHPSPPVTETTVNVAPGEFVDIQFTVTTPGNWIFHCHFPHHTSNMMLDGYNGSPVGMTRVFNTAGFPAPPAEYFAYDGDQSEPAPMPPALAGGPGGTARLITASAGQIASGEALAFFPGFAGEVRVASADVNGDNVEDFIAGAGPGGGPRVVVIDGKTRAVLANVFAFEPGFTGGVNVAAGDLDGDDKAEVVVSADQGGGPRVVVFRGGSLAPAASFFGIADANFRGGARAAVGDVNADGFDDLVVGAGAGGGPRVAVYDGTTVLGGSPARLVNDFFGLAADLPNGVYLAVGDVDGDLFADLIVGAGPGGGPRVRVLSGQDLVKGRGEKVLADFLAGNPADRGGVRVTAKNLMDDNRADLITAVGGRVAAFAGKSLNPGGTPQGAGELDPFPDRTGGVSVG